MYRLPAGDASAASWTGTTSADANVSVNLGKAHERGIVPATIRHPWNAEACGRDGYVCADDWPGLGRYAEANKALIASGQKVQELVKANGFIKGFSSITADSNADWALLYTGKAAMMLHGGWAYGGMKAVQPKFVASGLGWGNFPTVSGGKGDPKNTVGNPANYFSISSKATDEEKTVAKAYFVDGMNTDAELDAFVKSGQVPIVKAAEPKLASSPDAPFLQFVFNLTKQAPNFQQSWDQALSPTQATELLNNIDQLFLLKITPEQFATAMNATIGK